MERGKTLRDLVVESGLSQQAIANMLDVNRARVNAMLNADDMKVSTAIKLAKILGVSLKTLARSIGMDIDGIPDDCGGNEDR